MSSHAFTSLFANLWNDDGGAVLASEYMALGSVVVLGGVAGLSSLRDSVNDEMKEFGGAIRSMRQSYSAPGFRNGVANTAGSAFRDRARGAARPAPAADCTGDECN